VCVCGEEHFVVMKCAPEKTEVIKKSCYLCLRKDKSNKYV